ARLLAGGGERRLREGRRVGSHVGDVAVLVEALGHAHGRLCGEAELAAGVLLQRRRHERRAGTPRVRLALDAANPELRSLEPLSQPVCALRVQQEQRFVAKVAVAAEVTAATATFATKRCSCWTRRAHTGWLSGSRLRSSGFAASSASRTRGVPARRS